MCATYRHEWTLSVHLSTWYIMNVLCESPSRAYQFYDLVCQFEDLDTSLIF